MFAEVTRSLAVNIAPNLPSIADLISASFSLSPSTAKLSPSSPTTASTAADISSALVSSVPVKILPNLVSIAAFISVSVSKSPSLAKPSVVANTVSTKVLNQPSMLSSVFWLASTAANIPVAGLSPSAGFPRVLVR